MTIAADPRPTSEFDELTEGQKAVIAYGQAKAFLENADEELEIAIEHLTEVDDTSLISEVNRARSAVASVVHHIPDRMKP